MLTCNWMVIVFYRRLEEFGFDEGLDRHAKGVNVTETSFTPVPYPSTKNYSDRRRRQRALLAVRRASQTIRVES
jgi:hypothetical protein